MITGAMIQFFENNKDAIIQLINEELNISCYNFTFEEYNKFMGYKFECVRNNRNNRNRNNTNNGNNTNDLVHLYIKYNESTQRYTAKYKIFDYKNMTLSKAQDIESLTDFFNQNKDEIDRLSEALSCYTSIANKINKKQTDLDTTFEDATRSLINDSIVPKVIKCLRDEGYLSTISDQQIQLESYEITNTAYYKIVTLNFMFPDLEVEIDFNTEQIIYIMNGEEIRLH